MDQIRNGKRPFSSNESKEKKDEIFPNMYSAARSQQDMSTMVSVLSQVIGNTSSTITTAAGNTLNHLSLQNQPQPNLQQGIYTVRLLYNRHPF